MQTSMPDFKKYFPNCSPFQGEMPAKQARRAHSFDPASLEPCVAVDQQLFTDRKFLPKSERLDEQSANRINAPPVRSSNRKLIWLCALGWAATSVGVCLWLGIR